jgi:hypothetical protein
MCFGPGRKRVVIADLNPYAVLGVPFGAPMADVQAAADRRRAGLADGDTGAVDGAEVDRAVSLIAALSGPPEARVGWFRLPLDGSVLAPPAGTGLLRPEPAPLERRNKRPTAADRRALTARVAAEAAQLLVESVGATVTITPPYSASAT